MCQVTSQQTILNHNIVDPDMGNNDDHPGPSLRHFHFYSDVGGREKAVSVDFFKLHFKVAPLLLVVPVH